MDDPLKSAIQWIKLSVDSRLEEVSLVGAALRGICASVPLSETEASQMEVCVVEIVNNAIKHSYHLQPGHPVDITVLLYPERIEFIVDNTGEPMREGRSSRMDFDPQDVQALPEGGMGLHIVKSIMDELIYESIDGTNTFRMSKRFREIR
jgi:serine/threonine-protein kinase RsbW